MRLPNKKTRPSNHFSFLFYVKKKSQPPHFYRGLSVSRPCILEVRDLINDYLTGRKQRTKNNDTFSFRRDQLCLYQLNASQRLYHSLC